MLPLFDMMLRAQNGEGMQALAAQFGLAQEQAAQAMAALLPAFSAGLKRTSANPYDLSSLMSSLFTGGYAKYFEDMSKGFMPQGTADGNAVLEKLFGSPEVSRAIAAQAEQLTGISQDIFKKMMPALADTLMGGLFKQMTGQLPGANQAMASAMNQMSKQWLEGLGLQPKQPPQTGPFDNPMTDAIRSMWGFPKQDEAAPASQDPFAGNPFAKAFQDMMAGGFPTAQPGTATPGSPQANAGTDGSPYPGVLNSMFDSGLDVQKTYQKSMEDILDRYLRNGAKDKPATASGSSE